MVDAALAEARVAIHDLRPTMLDDLGLGPSIRALAPRSLGHDVTVALAVDDSITLPPHHEVALYRIAQEALNNVRRHAGASSVEVALQRDDGEVLMRISDDGRGFEPDAPRRETTFGLLGISERAALLGGRLSVRSAPGRGTTLEVHVPAAARTPEETA